MTMKRLMLVWVVILGMLGSVCFAESIHHPIEPYGKVPDEWTEVVRENRLGNVRYMQGDLFRMEGNSISHVDTMGNVLAFCKIETDHFFIRAVIATSDGGFLFTQGFSDFQTGPNHWLSDDGVVSRIVKCAVDGTIEWICDLKDVTGQMLQFCFETESGYCFLGDRETPETKRRGVSSCTDLSCLIVDKAGTMEDLRIIGGSDFDILHRVERNDKGYTLYATIQSMDGCFQSFRDRGNTGLLQRINVDENFQILDMIEVDWHEAYADVIGTVDGKPVLVDQGEMRDFLPGFNAGTPLLVLDKGPYFLVLSKNSTGEVIGGFPFSGIGWFEKTESVYSAYDKAGILLWRAAAEQ